jgi:DNA-binding response OmpR family regulator
MPIRVLTVDDDTAMTELLSMLLRTYGFEVLGSNSSAEGIERIRKEAPDIVLLDLMMPDMNGQDMCKAIRAFSDVPIIVLSALDNPGIVANALDAGADDYLIKPVSSKILVAHINQLARRTGKLTPSEHLSESSWVPGSKPVSL